MISKISFKKLVFHELKDKILLLVISMITFFILLPIGESMNAREFSIYEYINNFSSNGIGYISPGFVDNMTLRCVFVAGFAIICGVVSFRYLHSKVQVDLYHSLAISRGKLFLVNYVSGMLLFIIPLTLNFILSLLISGGKGAFSKELITYFIYMFFVFIVYFMTFYCITVTAMLLTGKMVVGLLCVVAMLVYGALLHTLSFYLVSNFFYTVDNYRYSSLPSDFIFSPITLFQRTVNILIYEGAVHWFGILYAGIIIIALTGLNLWLSMKRPSEAAGKSIAFPKVESPLKVLLVIPLSLGVASFAAVGSDSPANKGAFYLGALFGVFLINAVIEFIYTLDIKETFRKKGSLVIALVGTFIIIIIYRLDLTGYDKYLPDKNNINTMSIVDANNYYNHNNCYNYPMDTEMNNYIDVLDKTTIQDFEPIYEFAKAGVTSTKQLYQEWYNWYMTSSMESAPSVYIKVKYCLKDGTSDYRQYVVSNDIADRYLTQLYENEEYKEKVFSINYIDLSKVNRLSIKDNDNQSEVIELDLSQIEREKLIKEYKEETNLLNYKAADRGNIVGTLIIKYNTEEGEDYLEYNVYASFTNTISLLKQMGYEF